MHTPQDQQGDKKGYVCQYVELGAECGGCAQPPGQPPIRQIRQQ